MNKNHQNKSFTDNVLLTLGTRILLFVVNLLSSILTARVLGPYDRGLVSVLFNMTTTLDNFCRLGISPANIYMISHEKEDVSDVVTNSIFFAFLFGILGIVVLLWFKNYILSVFLWNAPQLYLILAISVVPMHILDEYFTAIFIATNRFGVMNTRSMLSKTLTLAGFFTVLVIMGRGLTEILVSSILISFFMSLFMLWTIHKYFDVKFKFNPVLVKKTISYGLKSYFQTMTSYFHLKLDIYLLAMFLGPEQIAFYTIGSRMAELVLVIPSTLTTVIFPKLTSKRDIEERDNLTSIAVRQIFLIVSLITMGFWLVGGPLIAAWYGKEYLQAVTPFKIILPGVGMLSIYSVINRYFMSKNKQKISIMSGLLVLGINLGLNLILIPKFGIEGAAVASSISYTLAAMCLLKCFLIESNQRLFGLMHFEKREFCIYSDAVTSLVSIVRLKRKAHI